MEKLRRAIRSAPFSDRVQRSLAFTDTESVLNPHLAIEYARKSRPSFLQKNHAASGMPSDNSAKRDLEEEQPEFRRRSKLRKMAEQKAAEANIEAAAGDAGDPSGEPRAEIAASLSYRFIFYSSRIT